MSLTTEVTNKVLYYLRYKRRIFYLATEVGLYHSDILAISRGQLLEIEVKVSLHDLKRDFLKTYSFYGKSYKKHEVYAHANSQWTPHRFFFAVPEKMVGETIKYLESVDNRTAGIISVNTDIPQKEYDKNIYCKIVRRAKILHKNEIKFNIKKDIIMRMSSELVTDRQRLDTLGKLVKFYQKSLEDKS